MQIHEDHLHPHHHLRHLSQPKHHQHHHQHPHRISINLTTVIYSHASCHPSLLFTLIIGWITLQNEIMPRSHCEKPLAHQMRHHPEAAPRLPVLSTRAHGFRARRPRTSRARRRRCLGRSVGSGGNIIYIVFFKLFSMCLHLLLCARDFVLRSGRSRSEPWACSTSKTSTRRTAKGGWGSATANPSQRRPSRSPGFAHRRGGEKSNHERRSKKNNIFFYIILYI